MCDRKRMPSDVTSFKPDSVSNKLDTFDFKIISCMAKSKGCAWAAREGSTPEWVLGMQWCIIGHLEI